MGPKGRESPTRHRRSLGKYGRGRFPEAPLAGYFWAGWFERWARFPLGRRFLGSYVIAALQERGVAKSTDGGLAAVAIGGDGRGVPCSVRFAEAEFSRH